MDELRLAHRVAHMARGRLDVGRFDVAAVDELRPVAASRTWREADSTWAGSTAPVDELRPVAASAPLAPSMPS